MCEREIRDTQRWRIARDLPSVGSFPKWNWARAKAGSWEPGGGKQELHPGFPH